MTTRAQRVSDLLVSDLVLGTYSYDTFFTLRPVDTTVLAIIVVRSRLHYLAADLYSYRLRAARVSATQALADKPRSRPACRPLSSVDCPAPTVASNKKILPSVGMCHVENTDFNEKRGSSHCELRLNVGTYYVPTVPYYHHI